MHIIRRCSIVALLVALTLSLVGWSADVDGSLGFDMVPSEQHLEMRRLTIKGDKIVQYNRETGLEEERLADKPLFITTQITSDSLKSSNLGTGYFGIQRSDTLGTRKAGFASTMIYMNQVDTEFGFGYRPIFDTVKMLLEITDFGGDTLMPIRYNVFELRKPLLGNVVNADDSVAYVNCDMSQMYDATQPIFTFTFPKDESQGPSTLIVDLDPVRQEGSERLSSQTWDFVRRLMLIPENYDAPDSDWDQYGRSGLEIYQDETKWSEAFYGLYVEPDASSLPATSRGAMYGIDLKASGLFLQGRNRNPQDPSLIKDTVGMYYYFRDTETSYHTSVNKVSHDYEQGRSTRPLLADVKMSEALPHAERTPVSTAFVYGMSGPAMELYFTDAFITEMLSLAEGDGEVGINQCLVSLFLSGADYDWERTQSNYVELVPLLESSPERLGMYTKFSSLQAILDYDFTYEATNDTECSYDGYIYRSRANYQMNITAHMQRLYNYARTLTRHEDGSYDFEENRSDARYTPRTVQISMEAIDPFNFGFTALQGADDAQSGNAAPIKIDLTYTIINGVLK